MNRKKKNEVYNKMFIMAVYILQAEKAHRFKEEMKELHDNTLEKVRNEQT